jgi:hypothetical protein
MTNARIRDGARFRAAGMRDLAAMRGTAQTELQE